MTREEAIKVLETERAWIKTLYEVSNLIVTTYKASFIEAFDMAIEALQERPKGRWTHLGGDEWCCTNCGFVISTEGSWEDPTAKFCENCGVDMKGE